MQLTKIFSPAKINAVKCSIMADYSETCPFILLYVNSIGIIIQWKWLERGFSRSIYEYRMGKPWPPNIVIKCLNLLVWANLCFLFILLFKPCSCNGPETEMKWKTDIENQYNIIILSYTESWCLVSLGRNTSCVRKRNGRLCYDYREKGRQINNI